MADRKTQHTRAQAWHAGLVGDAMTVVRRLQTVISFQVADVLQLMLNRWLDQLHLFAAVVLFCLLTECVIRYGKLESLSMLRRVGVIQLGQSLLELISDIQRVSVSSQALANCVGWLLRTATLCVPAMLYADVRANEYVANAITVYLYQYTASTREFVLDLNFGLPSVYLAALCVLLSMRAQLWKQQHSNLYVYFFKAMHMLIVELVLSSISASTVNSPDYAKVLLTAVAIVAIDAINMSNNEMLSEIRGYAIWRIAKQLFDLDAAELDFMSTLGLSLLIFVARRCVEHLLTDELSRYMHTAVEILFLTSINLILQPIVNSHTHTHADHVLLVLIVATAAQAVEHWVLKPQSRTK